ncbi:MAG TPA: hypothetical protein VFA75_17770 [Nevskia sp.]|nr:hypothetical protein [Nevskia sp.]
MALAQTAGGRAANAGAARAANILQQRVDRHAGRPDPHRAVDGAGN